MAFWDGLVGTLRKALSTIRHPTRGIKRAIGRVAIRGLRRLGASIRDIEKTLTQQQITDYGDDLPEDIFEIASQVDRENLIGTLDTSKRLPRNLYTNARLRQRHKYLVTWRVDKRYRDTGAIVNEYVSGYIDEEMTPDDWWEEYQSKLAQSRYDTDYDVVSHTLASVQHHRDLPY